MENPSTTSLQASILPHIEQIAQTLKGVGLTESNKKKLLKPLQPHLEVVGNFLHCEQEDEVWLFSILFALSISSRETDLESLTDYLGCSPFMTVQFVPVLERMVQKRLLVKSSGYDTKVVTTRYQVSSYVFNAVSFNKPVTAHEVFVDVYEVIERINELICERERNSQLTKDLIEEVMALVEAEQERFPAFKKLLALSLPYEDNLLLLYLFYAFANESNEADLERYIYYVYDSMGSKIRVKKNLYSGGYHLIEDGWVCFVDDSFYGGREISLTDRAIEYFFNEDLGNMAARKSFVPKHCVVIAPDKTTLLPLYFNSQEQKSIDLVAKLLEEENFQRATAKLSQMRMRPSITMLLHGAPGTGKTQWVYNLGHETGRHVLMVDISSIRDKYLGESEKRIKQVFKTYQQAKEHYPKCPILLFNESDALISKRYEVSSSADQMNNAMQNILLQELEDFEGILIATSNLSLNLDAAFERRFLYKIPFQKPDEGVRAKIWLDKMPEIDQTLAQQLAQQFQLTGGQIQNIARRYLLENLLNDAPPTYEILSELCRQEFLQGQGSTPVGF
ncbi:ATP-binding protein [Eisenibacter elegans]|jgi:hypothetical protein|uniref:ATP-binding protein n=1 Tax=Eisenibacter elegans TaxID=997 RepID=UPI0003F763D7|nr:ATP-binding protein [Eisenibacter elegans]